MNHLLEWRRSCVADELTRLNVRTLDGLQPLEYLLYAETLPRRNDGRVADSILKRYRHLDAGGWWCSGIDILTGTPDLWGCFKPRQPRCSSGRGKLIKYEHPPQVSTGIFALRVPLSLWQRIAERYQVAITPEDIKSQQADLGFWQWVLNHPTIPLCITEGAKKAGALLSAGYVAIALPGINSGYRTPKDEFGRRIGKSRLIPQLQKIATSGREIYLTFDQDSKPSTVQAVNTAIQQTGYLLSQAGCAVKVIGWPPEWGKGVDDFIATKGQAAFEEVYHTAMPLEVWRAQLWRHLSYAPNVELNHRFLPALTIPQTAKLIALKSPKGTGKTRLLEQIVKEALARGKWVLVIGHRVRLVEALCRRFSLKYVTWDLETKAGETEGERQFPYPGYGLCIDSLHPQSQARFQAESWQDGVVIIDEVEQVLWHGLNSSTCRLHRPAILKSLKTLIQNVLGGEGQVFIADADLSDPAINYFMALAGVPVQPYVILNHWKPTQTEAWTIYSYGGHAPDQLVKDLETHIREGGKPFVCLSAQKPQSLWGTRTLEAYLQQQFPEAKILRLDSESLADPTHPAYGVAGDLNQRLLDYDIVLASPSIETGVSLDLQGHFTSVWAIAIGVQAENSVRQALGRLRETVPRYIWAANQGLNRVGNGSTSIPALLNSDQRLTQVNIRLLQQADFEAIDDLEMGFQAESLLCWAKMAVRVNSAMLRYRESILANLAAEGHQIILQKSGSVTLINSSFYPKKNWGSEPQQVMPEKRLFPQDFGTFDEELQEIEEIEFATGFKINNSLNPNPQTAKNSKTLIQFIGRVRDQNYQAECETIALAPALQTSHYQRLKRQGVKTLEERRAQRKYELIQRYGIPVTPALVIQDDAGWYEKLRLHYFLTVGRPYLAEQDVATVRSLIQGGSGNIFWPDFNRSQWGATVGILEWLGVPCWLQAPQPELRNTDEELQDMAKRALINRKAIKMVIGIQLPAHSKPITIVKGLLKAIGCELEFLKSEFVQKKQIRVYQARVPDDGRFAVFQNWLNQENSVKFKTSPSGD